MRRRRRKIARRLICALAMIVAAGAIGLCSWPSTATATLVKATPVVIEVTGGGETGSFTLHCIPKGGRVDDSGPAVRDLSLRPVFSVRRGPPSSTMHGSGGFQQPSPWSSVWGPGSHMTGTEVLTGANGTLTLAWSGTQILANGRWGRITGRWSIVEGSGTYESVGGRGTFVFTPTRAVAEYRGVLIVAV